MVSSHQNALAISSILENSRNNEETDILEYCTPNYATNTSKLFSTKENKSRDSSDSNYLGINKSSGGYSSRTQEQVEVYSYGK